MSYIWWIKKKKKVKESQKKKKQQKQTNEQKTQSLDKGYVEDQWYDFNNGDDQYIVSIFLTIIERNWCCETSLKILDMIMHCGTLFTKFESF